MKKLLLSLISVLLVEGCSVAQKSTTIPQIWDMKELQASKSMAGKSNYSRSLVKNSSRYLADEPITVTTKSRTFAPNNHYYCSIGPYWWPDEEHPGKYINRDGRINPESRQYDRDRLIEMTKLCQELSKAFYVSGERDLYYAFVRQLKAWFIDEETYMYPNFEYSQVIPGQRENRGRSTGMVDAYYFNTLIESIRLLDAKKQLPKSLSKSLQEWFFQFSDWMAYSDLGVAASKGSSNTGLAYDVTLLNCALYAGNTAVADTVSKNFYKKRVEAQIKPDGSQPNELLRTNAYSYSVYNLTHIVDFCLIQQSLGNNFYADHRERIDAAINYLIQFIDNELAFKYQQIGDIKPSERELMKEVSRLRRIGCDIQVDDKIYKRFNPYVKIENVLQ